MVAWVNVPVLSSSFDTDIHLYYGNTSVTSATTSTATWSSEYEAVLHLNQDPTATAPQFLDSSPNGNSGTAFGTMTSTNIVAGITHNGVSFDEIDDHIEIPDHDYGATNAFSISFWFNVSDNTGSSYQYMLSLIHI